MKYWQLRHNRKTALCFIWVLSRRYSENADTIPAPGYHIIHSVPIPLDLVNISSLKIRQHILNL